MNVPVPARAAAAPVQAAPAAERCDPSDYRWLACRVPPVGSLRDSVRRHGRLVTFWASDCGCGDGQPRGKGEVRWCAPGATQPCGLDERYGSAFGAMREGRLQGHVELRTWLGQYLGTLDAQGGYQSGVLLYESGARFIGRFDGEDGYRAGTLYQNGVVRIASAWLGSRPVGAVLEAQSDGSYRILQCSPSGACHVRKDGQSSLLSKVWHAAGDAALGAAGSAVREQLAGHMALLRRQPYAFAFDTAMAFTVNALREP